MVFACPNLLVGALSTRPFCIQQSYKTHDQLTKSVCGILGNTRDLWWLLLLYLGSEFHRRCRLRDAQVADKPASNLAVSHPAPVGASVPLPGQIFRKDWKMLGWPFNGARSNNMPIPRIDIWISKKDDAIDSIQTVF